jgi:hypothetical protein
VVGCWHACNMARKKASFETTMHCGLSITQNRCPTSTRQARRLAVSLAKWTLEKASRRPGCDNLTDRARSEQTGNVNEGHKTGHPARLWLVLSHTWWLLY